MNDDTRTTPIAGMTSGRPADVTPDTDTIPITGTAGTADTAPELPTEPLTDRTDTAVMPPKDTFTATIAVTAPAPESASADKAGKGTVRNVRHSAATMTSTIDKLTIIYNGEKPVKARKRRAKTAAADDDGAINRHIFRDVKPPASVVLDTDSSREFRRTLEPVGSRYHVTKLIGEGGYSQVFLAKDNGLGRQVVVKSLRDKYTGDEQGVEKFINEAALNAQLIHHAIPAVYSLNTDSRDGLHLAMQYVEGITLKVYLKRLREYCAKHRISAADREKNLKERLEIFLRICDAIQYCHRRGVVHCDLKPENIMVARFGAVHVMDWGIADFAGTVQNAVSGTPSYLAPERVKTKEVDVRADIFALGMILNEMVFLQEPVTDADPMVVLKKIEQGKFAPSQPALPGIRKNPVLAAIIEKARNLEASRRYDTVAELSGDIRHYLFFEPVSAYREPWLQKLLRFLLRHRGTAAAGIAAVLLLLATLVTAQQMVSQRREQQTLLTGTYHAKMSLFNWYLAEGINDRINLYREQTRPMRNGIFHGVTPQNQPPAYGPEAFRRGSTEPPPGLLHVSFFPEAISLKEPVWFNPGNADEAEVRRAVALLRPLIPLWQAAVLSNNVIRFPAWNNSAAAVRNFYLHGSILRRITYVLPHGLVCRYPGMAETAEQIRSYLDNNVLQEMNSSGEGEEIRWSNLWIDESGENIITGWQFLHRRDSAGTGRNSSMAGALGIDVVFTALVRHLAEASELLEGQSTFYLVDNERRVIFTTEGYREFQTENGNTGDEKLRQFIGDSIRRGQLGFRYPLVLEQILEQQESLTASDNHLECRIRGRRCSVNWAPVEAMNWLLIQITPSDRMDIANKLQAGENTAR